MYVSDDVVFYFYFNIAAACALCSVIDLHIAKPKCDKKTFRTKPGTCTVTAHGRHTAALSGMNDNEYYSSPSSGFMFVYTV